MKIGMIMMDIFLVLPSKAFPMNLAGEFTGQVQIF